MLWCFRNKIYSKIYKVIVKTIYQNVQRCKIEIIPAKLIHPCDVCNKNCELMQNENEDESP